MPEIQKEYYSTREAAAILNVAVSTIQLWTNNGLLAAWVTGGGHRRITRSSVEHILKQQQVLATASVPAQTVLVVEDDAQQLRLYEKQFEASQLQLNVVTARDGYEGLIKIGHILPDVIIADLMMPNLDGFQMISAMKKMPELQNSLIIVVTGLTTEEINSKGELPEGVHVFVKPVPFDALAILMREHVKVKAA